MDRFQVTEAEKQLIIALARLSQTGRPTDRAAVEQQGEHYFGMYRENWSEAWLSLIGTGLVEIAGETYRVAPAAQALADEYLRRFPRHKYFYNEYFTRTLHCAAHARFCERTYGRNLCQHGMMDMAQLELLLQTLKPGPHSRLLELGCGNGMVAEYMSDVTGAHVTGVDTSSVGIEQANERTRDKQARLTFICDDMLTVSLPAASFDAVIAIDTLYFVHDLEAMVHRMHDALKPQGRIAAFHSSGIGPEPPEGLPGQATKLSQALDKQGIPYTALDLTAQERAHWKNKYRVALEMESEFRAEGSTFLYYSRHIEAQQVQQFLDSPHMCRYLYVTEQVQA